MQPLDPRITPSPGRWLDRPISSLLRLDCEQALYGLFIALAIVSRLWDLGRHIISHDETVHAQWSWHLYQGSGYSHHPLSHGPFLFHSTALSFYLFGDNEFTARLVPAVLGIMLVVLPYTLRRWLGRGGALVASFLFLISPSLLYYARYARNDVPIVLWALIAALAIFRYLGAPPDPRLSAGRARWLIVLSAALSLMFATKEVAFFYVAIFGSFLVLLFLAGLGFPRRSSSNWEWWKGTILTLLGLLAIILLATGLLLNSLCLLELFPIHYQQCDQAPVAGPRSGEMQCAEAGCEFVGSGCKKPIRVIAGDRFLEFDQAGRRIAIQLTRLEMVAGVLIIGIITVLTCAGAYALLVRLMPWRSPASGLAAHQGCERTGSLNTGERPALDLIIYIGTFTLPFLAHVFISGLSRFASRFAFGIDAAFDSLDYSEAGLLRSAGSVFILLAVSVAVGLWWDWRRWLVGAGVFYLIFVVLFTTVFTNGNGLATGVVGSLGYWLEQQAVERGGQPLYYYGLMVSLYEYLPLVGFAAALTFILLRRPSSVFVLFTLYWAALSWPIYSIAGERMPWMTVHITAPMILASSWVIGRLIAGTDWGRILSRAGWVVFAVTPIALAALVQTLSPWLSAPGNPKPFSGFGVGQLNTTLGFLSALTVLLVMSGVLHWIRQQIGGAALWRVLAALALVALAVLTLRTAWAFAYINYDNASEFLVYAHGSPDVRVMMEQVEEISGRLGGGRSLDIGYTADGSYPIMWYLRNYPNALQLPNPPGRTDLEKSVIIAGDAEWAGIEPYLGEGYQCNRYNFMWWPMQDYDGLSGERIRYALTNADMRGAVWDVIFRRDYARYEQVTEKPVRLSNWPLRDGVRFCVRRDVMARMWGQPTDPVWGAVEVDTASSDRYAGLELRVDPDLEIGTLGQYGSLNGPHGMALDEQGFLYVADTLDHRVVKFSPQGQPVDAWESQWWHDVPAWTPSGCLDGAGEPLALGDGEFCEPWGVAVGPDGDVYVADTWNHRVQVFTSRGEYLSQVGSFGQSGSAVSSAEYQFYGPRDLVVAGNGDLYVSDTGNKRIQVFGPGLLYQRSLGGAGIIPGRLDEPVGLAIGPDNLMYVADTWNNRVQAFGLDGAFAREWPVADWGSQNVSNKPYVATDSVGRVYVADPEAGRVIVFDSDGVPLGLLYLPATAGGSQPLPGGVALDEDDNVWVSDAANHRLLRFPALESFQSSGMEQRQNPSPEQY